MNKRICNPIFFIALLAMNLIQSGISQPSRIELKSHFSSTLSQTKEFNILYPEGYDSETDRYPVVYLFRGAVDEWADPTEDGARRGNIKTVYDSLFAKHKVGKMILIMPGLGAPASQNEYLYLVNDLFPYIDANYRTIPDRWHRAIDGFSLGGTVVTNLLASVPELFTSVGSYDGTLNSPYFDNSKFTNASSSLIYSLRKVQLLYHTASLGGNNNSNNMAVFTILNSKGIYNSLPSYTLDGSAQHNWFYADWHVAVTLPLHWNRMQSAENSLALALKTPLTGQTLSGNVSIDWTRLTVPNTLTTHLMVSSNNGRTWFTAFSTTAGDSTYTWHTVPMKDGTRYKIKLICAGDSLFGSAVSGTFTVNNPGNGAPDVEFVNLKDRDTVSGNYALQWYAGDADNDAVTISIEISYNGGFTWDNIASSIPNSGTYLLNSRNLANSPDVLFRISGSDGTATIKTISPQVIIYNKRIDLQNALFEHVSGNSDASFAAVGMHIDSLRSGIYSIRFKDADGKKSYSVFNKDSIRVVTDAQELDGRTEGPLFDGFRLVIQDFPAPTLDVNETKWTKGSSPLNGEVKLLNVILETGTVVAKPFPSDYEVRISNVIIDTTAPLFGTIAQPVPFTVWNTTLNKKTKFIFVEIDMDGVLSRNDELYLFEEDSLNAPMLTWHLQFTGNETAANPVAGDVFRIKIMKPLTSNDTYLFIYNNPLSVNNGNGFPGSYALAQNFPNPFNPITTINFTLSPNPSPTGRGESPTGAGVRAELTIYDILGRRITTLVNDLLPSGNYSVQWNASSFSSGVYYYRLQSGQFTETKKMILTK